MRKMLVIAAAAFVAAPAQVQSTISVSMWVPAQHVVYKDMVLPFTSDVEKATGGRVRFNYLAKAVASPPGTLDAVRDDLAQLSFIVHGYTPGRFSLTKVIEMPLLADSSEVASVAYQRVHERHLAQAGEHRDVKLISVFALTPAYVFTGTKPVRTLQDLQNLKIRVPGGVSSDIMQGLGAVSLVKPASEIYELMRGGVIDGVLLQYEGYVLFNLQGLVRNATVIPGGFNNTSFAVVMNRAAYDRLAAPDRAAIDQLSGEAFARRAGRAEDQVSERGREEMRKNNVTFNEPDASLTGRLRAVAPEVERAWIGEAAAKKVDGAAALKDLREEIRKLAR
jgi:TRAP-type C4-dicarboxylate transport system substrate-binding protein